MDTQTQTDHVELQTANWALQLDKLVYAYLAYRKHDSGDGLPKELEPSDNSSPPPFIVEVLDSHCSYLSFFWLITNTNNFTARTYLKFHPLYDKSIPNEMLIHHGYLGCALLQPSLAISIWSLEVYHQFHQTCPRFSIEAQCKTLCHMHNVHLLL